MYKKKSKVISFAFLLLLFGKMITSNKKRIFYIVLITATLLWVAFIFGNSLKPAEESTADSSFVLELIHKIPFLGGVSHHFVRKMAHFSEFFVLGTLLSFDFFGAWRKNPIYLSFPVILSLLVPMCDETIQAFVAGRGSSVIDVWIDFSGAITAIFIIAALVLLILKKRKKS